MAERQAPEAVDLYVVYDGGDLPEPDLDAPLLETRYVRTEPRDVGASWDLAGWLRADRERREAAGAFQAGGDTEVIAPGWQCDPAELPTKPKALAKRLLAAGWDVRAGCSMIYVTRTLFVGNTEKHSQGDVRYGDRDETWWSVQAVLRREEKPVASFWASWVTTEAVGKKTATAFKDASMWDAVLGRTFSGGSGAAGEFDGWLAIFAPVPQK